MKYGEISLDVKRSRYKIDSSDILLVLGGKSKSISVCFSVTIDGLFI
jgi:hypothetical protein